MIRIRITQPAREHIGYRNLDILHDALVNAWICAGATPEEIIGSHSRPWNFAVLGWHHAQENRAHTLVVSSPHSGLSKYLERFKPTDVIYARASTAEAVDFSAADIHLEPDPIVPGQTAIGVVMLSPLAISRQRDENRGLRWHNSLSNLDLSGAINTRLSRLTGHTSRLQVEADRLYLRTHSKHDTLVQLKENPGGQRVFVIGMRAPLILQGPEEDLRLAWYTGIGEKTRNGFGCIGLAERGIGR